MSSTTTRRKRLLSAHWVAPMVSPLQRDAGVVIEADRIIAVGEAIRLRAAHPDAESIDFGDAIILPGLVNAHTHLELSDLTAGEPPASFTPWIERLLNAPRADLTTAVTRGIDQCLAAGVTTVGDITTQPHATRLLLEGRLRAVSFGEVRAMAQRRSLLTERVAAATRWTHTAMVRAGISPHAPYSIEADGYRRCLEVAKERQIPLATHLAETPDEAAFLATHSGPFRQLWEAMQAWDANVPTFDGGPIKFARSVGLLRYPSLLAHVNYCRDDELGILAGGRATVVYCPRTHRYFGHPPHRWRDMLQRGVNVVIGTDSCASSPDLNLVEDLRLVHQIAPEHPVEELWQMATARAAKALGWITIGSLFPMNRADAAVFDVSSDNPLREILETNRLPRQVWIAGERVRPSPDTPPASPC